jgi:hypothetical protein
MLSHLTRKLPLQVRFLAGEGVMMMLKMTTGETTIILLPNEFREAFFESAVVKLGASR